MSNYQGYQGNWLSFPVAIANGQPNSAIISQKGLSLCGILFPATFTGTTVTFLASDDGVNFVSVKNTTSGTALSYTIAQNTYQAINPQDFYGINFLKIVSGSNEGATRSLIVSLKGI